MGGITKSETLKEYAKKAAKGRRSSFWEEWCYLDPIPKEVKDYIDKADPWTILDLIKRAKE